MNRASRKRLIGALKDDRGAAALVLAAVISVIAFTALEIYLHAFVGARELAKAQSASSTQGRLVDAVFTYYLKNSGTSGLSGTLPCPETSLTPTGSSVADGVTCNTAPGIKSGVLPWKDLGLSQDDVVDAYGNYYTYVVSASANALCDSITNSYDSTSTEMTGKLKSFTDLNLHTPAGNRYVPFVIIAHGKNGLGALPKRASAVTNDPANNDEKLNKHLSTSGDIYADNYNGASDLSSYFDDQVYAPLQSDAEKVCKSLTPGGKLNATIADNFDGTTSSTPDATTYTTSTTNAPTIVSAANSTNNRVASFTTSNSYLANNKFNYNFAPSVRPVYVSAKWTPDPSSAGATDAGMSIATRATTSDLTSGTDDFSSGSTRGITFRFFNTTTANDISAAGASNHIYIKDNGAVSATSSGTYQLIRGKTYLIEAYDDGTNLWGRITQTDSTSNTAYVELPGNSNDHTGSQQVVFINRNSLSYLDEVTVGYPMLAAETDGAHNIIYSAAGTNGWGGTAPHNLTLEAWVRVKTAPTSNGVIISKWNANAATAAANQAYRLYLDSNRLLHLDIAGSVSGTVTTKSYSLSITPKLDTWTHIAVVYSASAQTISAYQDDQLATTVATTIDKTTGANDNNTQAFSVGAEFNTGSTHVSDALNADFSDVRVWEAAQSFSTIRSCYEIRIPTTTCPSTSLIVNWTLDPGYGGLASTAAAISQAGTAGSLSYLDNVTTYNAMYVGALAVYFRPFATDVCPSGTYAGTYQCDIRVASGSVTSGATKTATIPSNLSAVYAKVWGAGGGDYNNSGASKSSPGGSAGFSEGLIQKINSASISGTSLSIYVGGSGSGSTTSTDGGGGGAGTVIISNLGKIGIAAGGGGGGAYSDDNSVGASAATRCSNASNTIGKSTQCGIGGGGGGYNAATSQANDGQTTSKQCGGLGGDNAPFGSNPPSASGNCAGGGAGQNPSTSRAGGAGSSTHGVGGTSGSVVGGGSGEAASAAGTHIGGGGGGGGVLTSPAAGATASCSTSAGGGTTGGYDTANGNNPHGYGGGGGAGCADTAGGVANARGDYGTSTSAASCSLGSDVTATKGQKDIDVTTSLSSLNWAEGCTMTESVGSDFPGGAITITNVDTANNKVTLSKKANASGTTHFTASGTPTSTLSSTPGGNGDFYYLPSYVDPSTYPKPGVGGTSTSSPVDKGTAGAVVLIW